MGTACNTEGRIREVGIDVRVSRSVENIKEFKPKLEHDTFRNMRVFVEVDVGLVKVGAAELLCLFVPLLSESWDREVALGNCSNEP